MFNFFKKKNDNKKLVAYAKGKFIPITFKSTFMIGCPFLISSFAFNNGVNPFPFKLTVSRPI